MSPYWALARLRGPKPNSRDLEELLAVGLAPFWLTPDYPGGDPEGDLFLLGPSKQSKLHFLCLNFILS